MYDYIFFIKHHFQHLVLIDVLIYSNNNNVFNFAVTNIHKLKKFRFPEY